MPAVFREPGFEEDIRSLLAKYPSLSDDVVYLENLLRRGRVASTRCADFYPDWVWRTEVHITALEGGDAEGRCSVVYEVDRDTCHLWLLYDNDTHAYEEMVATIVYRRS